MKIFINPSLKKLKKRIKALELLMSQAQEILNQVKAALEANNDLLASQKQSFQVLTAEVKQLITQGDLTGATELLDLIAEQHLELVAAAEANTALAEEVDAVNGDPASVNVVTDSVVVE